MKIHRLHKVSHNSPEYFCHADISQLPFSLKTDSKMTTIGKIIFLILMFLFHINGIKVYKSTLSLEERTMPIGKSNF